MLGPNGSGKSTLIKGMLGLVDCYGGEVEWFGSPLDGFRDRWRVGYVPQRQLAACADPRDRRASWCAPDGSLAPACWAATGRPTGAPSPPRSTSSGSPISGAYPVGQLSGGQQRRALVARGLAGGPDVLVLDEPLAGVDA